MKIKCLSNIESFPLYCFGYNQLKMPSNYISFFKQICQQFVL